MQDFISFTLVGLAVGAVYAIAASGLVVTYTTSGIFNFAHGAVAMFSAFVYWDLRWGDGFTLFDVTWMRGHLPAPLALAITLFVFAPLFGLVVERVIMRGLEGTSEITKLVIPIALLLLLNGLAGWIWPVSAEARINRPFFGPRSKVQIGDVFLTTHDIIIVVVAIVMALALRFLLFQTRTGVAMRAVVDDRSLTMLNGGRPNRTSQVSWIVGIGFAALTGVLISSRPSAGSLSATPLTLLVVNAYAAAMFGRLRSLPRTFLGALGIGLLVSYWANYVTDLEDLLDADLTWLDGLRNSIPIILLFIVLLLLPQDRLRGAVVARTRERFRVPTVKKAAVWGAVFVAAVAFLQALMVGTAQNALAKGLALAIIALSIVLLTGYAGEVNLAPMTFAGIGAMVAYQFDVGSISASNAATEGWLGMLSIALAATFAVIVLPAFGIHRWRLAIATVGFSAIVFTIVWVFDGVGTTGDGARLATRESLSVAGLVLATLVAALVGALVALPALRLRGLYLGLATFSFAVFVTNMVFKQIHTLTLDVPFVGDGEDVVINLFTPGTLNMPRPHWFGIDFGGIDNNWKFLILLSVVFSLLGIALVALRRSGYGRMLAAMKDSPAACATLGLNLVRLKLSVFTLSAAIAGLGGALYGSQQNVVNEDTFIIFISLALFMLTVVGGIGYVSGALLGGLFAGVAFDLIRNTFLDMAVFFPAVAGLFTWIALLFQNVGSAGAAIGLADNPSGVASNFVEGYAHLGDRRYRPTVAVTLGVIAAAYVLALTETIGNWAFVIVLVGALAVLPAVALRSLSFLAPLTGWVAASSLIWWNTLPTDERYGEGALIVGLLAVVAVTIAHQQRRIGESPPDPDPDRLLDEPGRPFARADATLLDDALALGDDSRKLAGVGVREQAR